MADPTLEAEVFRQGICDYCGSIGDVTDDHVVPQCLWPGRVPKSAPIVYACRRCNHIWKSEYDTYLRDALVNDMQAASSPIVQKLRQRFYRSVGRNQSIMAREFAASAQLVGLQEPSSGIVYGAAYISLDANKRLPFIMSLIARGLYQYYFHQTYPADSRFDVRREVELQKIKALAQAMNEQGAALAQIGNGEVFQAAFWSKPNHPYIGLWLLNFYGRIRFLIGTNMHIDAFQEIAQCKHT